MEYLYWLLGFSVFFALLERVRPARHAQSPARPQLGNDLFYLIFNGHLYSLWFGGLVGAVALATRKALLAVHLVPEQGLLTGTPFVLQLLVFALVTDFLQWNIHRLLHRVPFLWQFHKVHHSIHRMDWAGAFRFHWVEIVVYKSLQYLPVLWLGGDPAPLFVAILFGTAWGHFNHSNVDIGIGPLGYVLNSPRMHLWHHDASDEGGVAKNFGIVFSLWDYLFGTVYWPKERPPERIGYPGDEDMPADLPRQLLFPLLRRRT